MEDEDRKSPWHDTMLEEAGIPFYIVIGDVLPVALNTRMTTSFRYDENLIRYEKTYWQQMLMSKRFDEEGSKRMRRLCKCRINELEEFNMMINEVNEDFNIMFEDVKRKSNVKIYHNFMDKCKQEFHKSPCIQRVSRACSGMGIKVLALPDIADIEEEGTSKITPRVYLTKGIVPEEILMNSTYNMITRGRLDTYYEIAGRVHGYPFCCIEKHIKRIKENEMTVKMSELHHDYDSEVMKKYDLHSRTTPYAFFADGFVPCSSKCDAAFSTGYRLFNKLSSIIPPKYIDYYYRVNRKLVCQGLRTRLTKASFPEKHFFLSPYNKKMIEMR